VKLLILAAGYGTRLADIAKDTSKAMLKIGQKSIIEHILDHVNSLSQLNELLVVTNNKYFSDYQNWADKIRESLPFDVSIINDKTTSNEDRLGSIGDIDYVLKHVEINDDLLVVGGDNLFNFNIDEFVAVSESKKENVTIGLFDINDMSQATKFGIVELGNDGLIASFEEKPQNPRSSLVAMCLYYLPKKTLGFIGEYLVQSGKSDRAGDYIIWLLKNYDVYGFNFKGKWFDIGSIESYNEAQEAFK